MLESCGQVVNGQEGVHRHVRSSVRRHLAWPFRQPIPRHTRSAFAALEGVLPLRRPRVLDSGCGTGASTRYLSERFPNASVVGVDRSRKRLGFGDGELLRQVTENAWLVRAELCALWMLAVGAKWALHAHYLLYPNPYPKAVHFKRRWPAHPALPFLLALGGRVELRSNWPVYVQEMAVAVRQATPQSVILCRYDCSTPWSAFEEKYCTRGQTLYRCRFGSPGRWWKGPAWLRTASLLDFDLPGSIRSQ